MKKRVSALLLTFCMLLTLVPASAFAEGADEGGTESYVAQVGQQGYASLAEAVEAAQPGETVELLESIALDKTAAI